MNVFVVEDEHWALLELKKLLEKYESIHNMYYFENGEDALNQVIEVIPDLVITDITMPGIDGLELVQKLKCKDDRIECILLTVHDTFAYAKKGINLGVADYILKPIKKYTLFETIDKTIESIQQRKQDETEKQYWSINRLLFQSIKENNFEVDNLDNHSFLLIYVLFGNWKVSGWQLNGIDVEEIRKLIGIDETCWFLSIDERRKLLLIPNQNYGYIADFPLDKLYQYLYRFGQVHICTLLKDENISLNESYQIAEERLYKSKLFGESTILNNLSQPDVKDIQHLWDIVRLIERQFRENQLGSIHNEIQKLIVHLKQDKITQKQLFRFLIDMYYAIIYKLQQSTSSAIKIDDIDAHLVQLETLVTYDHLKHWLTDLINKISKVLSPIEIPPKHLIPKVKEWIERSYSRNITFQQFADEHHVSLSYLSREFKEQTYTTFSEYLTNIRIQKAKELFNSGLERTVEVGELVGYKDPKHFRSVFKRITGLTPKEFKTRG